MSHLTFENRKTIASGLAHDKSCVAIAKEIRCDPTTIAKEIKKNRIISRESKTNNKFLCKKLEKFPYICRDCKHKYTDCTFTQLRYNAEIAQKKYEYRLHVSRQGINLTKEEHETLLTFLKEGKEIKRSLYNSVMASKVDVSVPTVYRYIQEKKINFSRMDLPYAVTYKKRKKANKQYAYPNNKVDRLNREYLDFLAYKKKHLNEMTVQMDFLGSIKTDKKTLLVLIIPEIHFPFLFLIENKNSNKIVEIFNELEALLGVDKFNEIFPSILTDRDPCFSDILGIEFSKKIGVQRTYLFFCDAFKSNQKANVENMNKQLRKFFPKKSSIDHYTQEQIILINKTINESPLFSLDGHSPKEAFILLFGLNTYEIIFGK